MPELDDPHVWLRDVADHLGLDPDTAADVIDELAGHIDDSVASLEADGRSKEDAEHEALRRLGDPRRLASSLRRAHQSRRRLLAAAGGGILGAADGAARAVVPMIGLLFVASVGWFGLGFLWGALTKAPASIPSGQTPAAAGIAAAAFIGFGAARRMAWAIARSAHVGLRPAIAVAAAIGATVLVAWAVAGPPMAMSWAVVATELTLLAAWLVGAASVGRIPDIRLTKSRLVAIAAVVAVAMFVQDPLLTPHAAFDRSRPVEPDLSIFGASLADELRPTETAPFDHPLDAGVYAVDLIANEEAPRRLVLPAGASKAQLELWPGVRSDPTSNFAAFAVGAPPEGARILRAAPLVKARSHLTGSIRFDDIRDLDAAWIVGTAVIDGKRVVFLHQPLLPTFHGNLLQWLGAPTPATIAAHG